MKTAVRYYSKLGNTEKIAQAIAEGAGIEARSIVEEPALPEKVDVLFLGGAPYANIMAPELKAFAEGLRAEGVPDILLVQEIRDRATCDAFAAKLGGDLGTAVCSDFWYNPTNRSLQQLAIFSRHPCVAAGFERWAAADFVYPPRGFAWAVFDVRGRRVACFDVHLKSNYVPEGQDEAKQSVLNRLKREISARQLASRIGEIAAANAGPDGAAPAVVVAGDFNVASEDPRFAGETTLQTMLEAGLESAFAGIPESERPTLPASERYPAVVFDHVFTRGLGKPLSRRVGRSLETSDHRRVYAEFAAASPETGK